MNIPRLVRVAVGVLTVSLGCGGTVEIDSRPRDAQGGVAGSAFSRCRVFDNVDECCSGRRSDGFAGCYWVYEDADHPDFQGACIADQEDCSRDEVDCPPGTRCLVTTRNAPGCRHAPLDDVPMHRGVCL